VLPLRNLEFRDTTAYYAFDQDNHSAIHQILIAFCLGCHTHTPRSSIDDGIARSQARFVCAALTASCLKGKAIYRHVQGSSGRTIQFLLASAGRIPLGDSFHGLVCHRGWCYPWIRYTLDTGMNTALPFSLARAYWQALVIVCTHHHHETA